MVKRTVKYSLGLLALLMVVLVVTPFFIDLNSYKLKITEAVEDATGRVLQIGEIDASLFPWVGIRLEDVRLANRDLRLRHVQPDVPYAQPELLVVGQVVHRRRDVVAVCAGA